MFLIDKYRPKTINDLIFHKQIMQELAFISIYENLPHIIISGPSECGKETLSRFFLELIFDASVNNLTKRIYNIHGASSKKEAIEILQSDHHIVIEPTNTNHDKYILQEIIKDYAKHKSFNVFKTNRKFKIIVINNLENLSPNSQAALRRTMELYAKSCRFVMICNNLSKVLDPLRSRCRVFCVRYPNMEEIRKTVFNIALMEKIDTKNIRYDSNLKKSIWLLDINRLGGTVILPIDRTFDLIVGVIMKVATCKDIIKVFYNNIRSQIYEVLITNVKGTDIIINLMNRLLFLIPDDEMAAIIIRTASEAEYNLIHGRRDIMHIDYFIAVVMKLLIKKQKKLK